MKKIVIIGGVAGGATAAARLRRLDEGAEIIIFEKGEYISFANCGLPYYVGGAVADRRELLKQTPQGFKKRFNVQVRVLSEVVSIDRENKSVRVDNLAAGRTYYESYDKLIIATGALPIIPPIKGAELSRVFTVRSIEDADAVKRFIAESKPKNAAVIGGGYIGMEMAENLKTAGLDVHVVELSDRIIARADADIVRDAENYIEERGLKLHLSGAAQSISEKGRGLSVKLQELEFLVDMVVMAVGVKPDSRLAADAGLVLNDFRGIVTDVHMRTSDPDIYAVGDAVEVTDAVTGQKGYVPLAGPANKEARIAADNICGIPSVYAGAQGSSVIKLFDMTVAATGINEKTARKLNINYDKVFLWLPGHAEYHHGSKNMSIKVIFEKSSGKLLGAQIVGFDGVDKRCDVLATAIRAGMTARDLTRLDLCYSPPYSSAKDPVNMAGYVIENVLNGLVKNIHWHDVAVLPKDGSVLLLDVRTPSEYAAGHIDGFINIPLDVLRSRIPALDKAKTVYSCCHSGTRSYTAARILTQNGFDVYNLSGGYRLYSSIFGKSRG